MFFLILFIVVVIVFGLALLILNENEKSSKEEIQSIIESSDLESVKHLAQVGVQNLDFLNSVANIWIFFGGIMTLALIIFFAYAMRD